eukprot:6039698-Prymnesium_polylepis.1
MPSVAPLSSYRDIYDLTPDSTHNWQLALAVLIPLVALVLSLSGIVKLYLRWMSSWTPAEREYLRRRWPADDALMQDLRKVRTGEYARQKLVKHLLGQVKEPSSGCESRFLSPSMIQAIEHNLFMRWIMADQLVFAYSTLSSEQVAAIICSTFVSDPAQAMLGAIDLAIASNCVASRHAATEPQLANACHALADNLQLIVRGLLWMLSHQDARVMREMAVGRTVWHVSKGRGVVVEHLFNPQRICVEFCDGSTSGYAKHSWDKLHTKAPRRHSKAPHWSVVHSSCLDQDAAAKRVAATQQDGEGHNYVPGTSDSPAAGGANEPAKSTVSHAHTMPPKRTTSTIAIGAVNQARTKVQECSLEGEQSCRRGIARAATFTKASAQMLTQHITGALSLKDAMDVLSPGNDDLMRLLSTSLGVRLVDGILRGELLLIVSLPELQSAIRKGWYGMAFTDRLIPKRTWSMVFSMSLGSFLDEQQWIGHVAVKVLAFPVTALYPPLEELKNRRGQQFLRFAPKSKWLMRQ